jgi:hypothetical protein
MKRQKQAHWAPRVVVVSASIMVVACGGGGDAAAPASALAGMARSKAFHLIGGGYDGSVVSGTGGAPSSSGHPTPLARGYVTFGSVTDQLHPRPMPPVVRAAVEKHCMSPTVGPTSTMASSRTTRLGR